MRKRGSRAIRSGPTREGKKALAVLLADPLPEDRAERYVEEMRRKWLRLAWSDQRIPMNKRAANRAYTVFMQAAKNHLKRDHDLNFERDAVVDGKTYYDPSHAHDMLHVREEV